MNPPRKLTPRERRVLTSFLFIAIPIMLLAMLGAAVSYGRISGIGPDDPISMAQLVVFTLFQIVAILVGLAVGGWVWVLAGRLLFRLSRSDVEGLLATGPQIRIASRYNQWCLDRVFGAQRTTPCS
jgi:hypothetical protein